MSGPRRGPTGDDLPVRVEPQLVTGLVCSTGEHRQVRQAAQPETVGTPSAVVGAVDARVGDGEDERAIGLVLPDGGLSGTETEFSRRGVWRGCRPQGGPPAGLESEHVGSEAFSDVSGVGVDALRRRTGVLYALLDAQRASSRFEPAAVLVEQRVITGGVGEVDVIEELLVRCGGSNGGRPWPAPVLEDCGVRRGSVVGAGGGDDVNGTPSVTEGSPENGVGGRPGSDAGGPGLEPVGGVGVDERRGCPIARDGELQCEVAVGGAIGTGAAIDALGKGGDGELETLEIGQLLGFGGEPVEVLVFEDVVEGEQPAHGDLRGRGLAVAVVLDPKRAVERAGVDVADTGRPIGTAIGKPGFAGNPGFDQRHGDLVRALSADAVEVGVLATGEHAGVEADEGEPFGLPLRPAEAAKGRGPLRERGERGGGCVVHGQAGPARRGRSRSAQTATSAAVHPVAGVTMAKTAPARDSSRRVAPVLTGVSVSWAPVAEAATTSRPAWYPTSVYRSGIQRTRAAL